MRTPLVLSAIPLLLQLVGAPPAAAQREGAVELGMDMSVGLAMYDTWYREWTNYYGYPYRYAYDPEDEVTVNVPVGNIRAGLFVTDRVQLEPSLGLQLSSQGGDTSHVLRMDMDLVVDLAEGANVTTPFLAFGGGVIDLAGGTGNGDGATQASAHVGGGVKLPVAERWAVRLQALGARAFETDELPSSWQVVVRIGMSFFSR